MAEPVAIAILAKAPVAGLAKTRLIPALGPEGAAALQARLTAQAVRTAAAAGTGPLALWATPDATHPSFADLARGHRLTLACQPDGDLGTRMLAAVAAASGPALVIGTDCPALTPAHLAACAATLRDGIDAVAIPAEDGGYVLIGLRRPEPAPFAGMTWGTAAVMAETRRRLARAGLSWREPARLWDVDRPADLVRLSRGPILPEPDLRSGTDAAACPAAR
ncbi:TIGR04282 family arsenosugar biosynthesis glycosyltransferase [Rhodoplanes sp. TEM]|uniref:TIGR04282 family arsenosugar biosynthesis glycosyltransferase n=1 Tax=Rhodoplanes tepidamans TaxID=200616 RepID=A0ABT5JHW3_RHOTP|nr:MULTISPECIES: TIGR04282 family arsenosugar biosynthesis glycosyltransferase [Rhodoplanes]MDC7788961.1 TIGR04282 family arsenosugar biosynthesis glycosyltransferase [Rhodoplanes tepidamans]MDC7987228.1 TIGR04282 family arsenosugar biosynthesis glycosyltransferase [Rhodoplanes sp. TEM]MDQ0358655.1 rSAM/selenodomain-associated transferase 1 [Rhodoplanes tepidamans]